MQKLYPITFSNSAVWYVGYGCKRPVKDNPWANAVIACNDAEGARSGTVIVRVFPKDRRVRMEYTDDRFSPPVTSPRTRDCELDDYAHEVKDFVLPVLTAQIQRSALKPSSMLRGMEPSGGAK